MANVFVVCDDTKPCNPPFRKTLCTKCSIAGSCTGRNRCTDSLINTEIWSLANIVNAINSKIKSDLLR